MLIDKKEKRAETVRKYRKKYAKEIAAKRKAYKAANAERLKKENTAYYAKNVEKIAAYSREHYKLNKERIVENKAAYYALYPEKMKEKGSKYYLANKKQIAAKEKIYREEFPEKGRSRVIKRRAGKLQATPIWFSEFDEFVVSEASKLAVDREKITGFKWHVDHIIPLRGKTVCGLHIGINLAVIPAIENLRKGNRHA